MGTKQDQLLVVYKCGVQKGQGDDGDEAHAELLAFDNVDLGKEASIFVTRMGNTPSDTLFNSPVDYTTTH